jgi:hypothetical protein
MLTTGCCQSLINDLLVITDGSVAPKHEITALGNCIETWGFGFSSSQRRRQQFDHVTKVAPQAASPLSCQGKFEGSMSSATCFPMRKTKED